MNKKAQKRKLNRSRYKLRAKNPGKLRLSIFRSNSAIYAQIIDDQNSQTLVSASSLEKEMRLKHKTLNIDAAKAIGSLIGERAVQKKIEEVYFDRGRYIFHGKVKALADAARGKGLKF